MNQVSSDLPIVRRRPKVQVFLFPPEVEPGQRLHVEAVLESRSDTPTDAITLSLHGFERAPSKRMETLALRTTFSAQKIEPGKHSFRAYFDLPPGLPPSHHGPHYVVEYDLTVHVDIPWWPDLDRSFLVKVTQPRVTPAPVETVFSSRIDPRKLSVEATIASTIVAPGGALVGAVSFGNTHVARKTMTVELAYVAVEHANGHAERVHFYAADLHRGPLVEGEPLPFRLTLLPGLPPTMQGRLGGIDWFFEISVTGWTKETLLRIPIEVRPIASDAIPARVNAIGRARRAALWTVAGAERGWHYDAETDAISKRFGDVDGQIVVEQRTSVGPHVFASFAFEPLGLAIDVKPKRWLESLVEASAEVDVPAFDAAFFVRAREHAQARSLLGGPVAELLASADEAKLNECAATLAWASSGAEPREFRRLLEAADALGTLLGLRIPTLPPPNRLLSWMADWRALATRLGGRVRPGRPDIIGGTLRGKPIAVRVVWANEDTIRGVSIEARRNRDNDLDRKPSKTALAARDVLVRLGTLTVDADCIYFEVQGEPTDPMLLEPRIDAVAELAVLLDARREGGPYR